MQYPDTALLLATQTSGAFGSFDKSATLSAADNSEEHNDTEPVSSGSLCFGMFAKRCLD